MLTETSSRRKAARGSLHHEKTALDVVVVLLDEGYASTAIAPIEVFHSAGLLWNWLQGDAPYRRFNVRTASVDGAEVKSVSTLGLRPECAIGNVDRADIIIISASGWDIQDRISRCTSLLTWLRHWHERGAYIAGICTGVAFLAESGLLDGRRATTHWAVADMLRSRYPHVIWNRDQFVTEDGRLLCGGGVYAAVDLSLYLVEKFCGHEVALQCAKSLLVSMPRQRQDGYAVQALSRPHLDKRIRTIEEYLYAHLEEDMTIEVLADRARMSTRNFIRRFKAAINHLPGAYLRMLRISAAKDLLDEGATSIQQFASTVGYGDVTSFRQIFKRHTGMTPAEYRRRFAPLGLARENVQSAALSRGGGQLGG